MLLCCASHASWRLQVEHVHDRHMKSSHDHPPHGEHRHRSEYACAVMLWDPREMRCINAGFTNQLHLPEDEADTAFEMPGEESYAHSTFRVAEADQDCTVTRMYEVWEIKRATARSISTDILDRVPGSSGSPCPPAD